MLATEVELDHPSRRANYHYLTKALLIAQLLCNFYVASKITSIKGTSVTIRYNKKIDTLSLRLL